MTVGLLDIIKSQYRHLPLPPRSLQDQTVIVTGSNTGLGLEAARHCVRLGAARVILAVRSLAKGEAAKDTIETSTGIKGVAEVWQLDLASYDSIRAFAKRAATELDRIDAVIENAGVAFDRWSEAEGSETTITVNVLGTFLLAVLLLPSMREKGRQFGILPRLTIVSSGLHQDAKFEEGQEDDIFDALRVPSASRMQDRYSTSKLLEVYTVRALASRLPVSESGVVINVLDPGLVTTELIRELGWLWWLQITVFRLLVARTPEMGSRTLLHAGFADRNSHGQYCSNCEINENWLRDSIKTEEGQKMQEKVWTQLAARLEKIEPGCVTAALQC